MPRPETVEQALQEIGKNAANYRYFFEKLNHASWLAPLAAKGRFKNPPAKVAVEGGVIFPPWPESQYLARMAKIPSAQHEVLEIVQLMPKTDNINVHNDLLAIALALPAAASATLVGRARSWVQSHYHGLVKYQIADLIIHLADGGETEAAFQLARDTFGLRSVPEDGDLLSPEPHGWIEDWHYEEGLKRVIPALVKSDGQRTLALLCELLVQALETSRQEGDKRHIDYSHIWHEAIEDDEYPPRVRNSLISSTRNAAENFVQQDPRNLARALGELRRYDWPLFKRLELDLLRRFPDAGMEEIIRVLPGVIDVEPPTHHEAATLLKTVFGQLPEHVQDDLLRRIDAGPPEEDVRKWLGSEATPDNISGFMTHWRARRYQLIANRLPPAWEDRARGVMKRAGAVRPLDKVNEGATWLGPTSPKTAEEMAQLGPAGVLAFLREWHPDPRPMQSTPEGLGRVLQEVIANDPATYVNYSTEFLTVDPTFVRFFFSGLETACKRHRTFDWRPVLELAHWVLAQPRTIPGRQKALMEADPDWGWTRGTIANLLEEGMRDTERVMTIAHRPLVWDILAPLTSDPEPTLEYEETYGGSNMEPSTLAINTVRGKAINAVVAYALWVRRDLDRQTPVPAMTFVVMPEVRAVLDEHLDVGREPTLTIRSIYGRHFPWLFLLDPDWARASVVRIFPADDAVRWAVAWEAYVTFCPAYGSVLPVLREQYRQAIGVLRESQEKRGRPDWRGQVAHHIVTFYWTGTISLDDPLVTAFFQEAPDDIRADAIGYIGRSLANTPTLVPDIQERLRALWSWRLQTARASHDIASYRHELSEFGWWFCSRKFEDAWSIEQLTAVLDATGVVEPDFKVCETLEALAPAFPPACVRCITRIAQADTKGWTTLGNRDHFMNILKTAIASGSVDAKNAATRLVEYLVARGDFEYRKLLP